MFEHCHVVFDEARRLVADGDHRAARRLFNHLGSCDAGLKCPRYTACTAALAAPAEGITEGHLRRLALTRRPVPQVLEALAS